MIYWTTEKTKLWRWVVRFVRQLFRAIRISGTFRTNNFRTNKWGTRRQNSLLTLEILESRAMLVSEGSLFSVDRTVSTAGLLGAVSAVAQWGDGTQTNLTVANAPATGPIKVTFNYSLDSTNFFGSAERKAVLQAAADIVFSKYRDVLAAITPTQTNTWKAVFPNPRTGAQQIVNGGNIAANEIVIYVGARDLPGTEVATAGPGGLSWSGTNAWRDAVTGRGQPGALGTTLTDVAPWGGSMTVDPTIKWHFGLTTTGLDADEYDFLSVVSHEFMHILGFGIPRPDVTSSWTRLVSNGTFTGANARAANGGQNVRLSSDLSHWTEGTQSNGQEALMDPTINNTGIRKLPTPLDIAGLQDIGWQLITQQARVTGSKIYADDGSYPTRLTIRGASAGQLIVDLGSTLVTNVAPIITNTVATKTVRVNTPLSITDIGTFTDPGFGSTETFRYEINWGDNRPNSGSLSTGTATIDRAGGVNTLTAGSFNGSHTYTSTGTYTVTYRIIDDNSGSAQRTFSVQVLPPPEIRLSLNTTRISETAGAAILTIDIVGLTNTAPVTVNLLSSDTTEAIVIGSVVIPAGSTRATAAISAIDDALLDGTQSVSFTASSGGIASAPVRLDVTDAETISLSLSIASVREDAGAGAAILRVTRSNTDRQAAVSVALISSSTVVTLPATVSIPAGAGFVDVGVAVADDSIVNGLRNVILRGSATGYIGTEVSLGVIDYEPIQWVSGALTLDEGTGVLSRLIDLSIPSPAPAGGVVLAVSSSVPGRLQIPATVTVLAGQTKVTVPISVINNSFSQNDQNVVLTASAPGYVSTSLGIRVRDDDRSVWTNPNDILDVDNNRRIEPLDALIIINYLNEFGIGQLPLTRPSGELFWLDVSGNGFIEPLDALLVINLLNERAVQ